MRELNIWHDHLEQTAWREKKTERWHGELIGHANALFRLGVIDDGELSDLLEVADLARDWVYECLIAE